jgi:hypothetical protein
MEKDMGMGCETVDSRTEWTEWTERERPKLTKRSM